MEIEKIKSYVGLAKRSRSFVVGLDNVLKSSKLKLVIYTDKLSDSSLNKLNNFVKTKDIDSFMISSEIADVVLGSEMIKVFAITDKGLANAIKKNLTEMRSVTEEIH